MEKKRSSSTSLPSRLTMPGQIHKAYKVMLKLIHPKYYSADQQIPLKIIKRAKGIAFVTVVKAGFVWSGTVGSGIVVAKLPDGTWSGPSSIGIGGMGWGALIGASVTDSVIVLNNDLAVKAFAGHGQVKFGTSLSVAAGPLGREAEAAGHAGDGGVAACYSYSHSRGLFAGLSLQGAIFMTRDSDNARFYGCPVKSFDILRGKVPPPDFDDLKKLYTVLDAAGNPEALLDKPDFKDSSNVSFRSSTGPIAAGSRGRNLDDLDDEDSNIPAAVEWGNNDEDDEAFAKAFTQSTVASKKDELLPGWVEVNTEGSGQPYYWHEATGKTQWEAPLKVKTVAAPPPPPPPSKLDPDVLPPGWTKVLTSQGEPYYWNEDKNLTQWEKPQFDNKAPVKKFDTEVPIKPVASKGQPMPLGNTVSAPQLMARAPSGISSTQQADLAKAAMQNPKAAMGLAKSASQLQKNPSSISAATGVISNASQLQKTASTTNNNTSRPAPQAVPARPISKPATIPPRPASLKTTQQGVNPFDSM